MQNDASPYLTIMKTLEAKRLAAADLSKVTCPVLILAGDSDGFLPLNVAESMKSFMKDAALKVLHTGHAAAIEAPKEFNQAVLDFMKKVEWPL
jgi:pimeloyl-ACP methyl ester carboxylesterase